MSRLVSPTSALPVIGSLAPWRVHSSVCPRRDESGFGRLVSARLVSERRRRRRFPMKLHPFAIWLLVPPAMVALLA